MLPKNTAARHVRTPTAEKPKLRVGVAIRVVTLRSRRIFMRWFPDHQFCERKVSQLISRGSEITREMRSQDIRQQTKKGGNTNEATDSFQHNRIGCSTWNFRTRLCPGRASAGGKADSAGRESGPSGEARRQTSREGQGQREGQQTNRERKRQQASRAGKPAGREIGAYGTARRAAGRKRRRSYS